MSSARPPVHQLDLAILQEQLAATKLLAAINIVRKNKVRKEDYIHQSVSATVLPNGIFRIGHLTLFFLFLD